MKPLTRPIAVGVAVAAYIIAIATPEPVFAQLIVIAICAIAAGAAIYGE